MRDDVQSCERSLVPRNLCLGYDRIDSRYQHYVSVSQAIQMSIISGWFAYSLFKFQLLVS